MGKQTLVSCPSFFEKAAREESHARTIALKIDFNDVHYLDFADKERFRYVGNLMNYDIYSEPLTNFFLQLHTFCMNRHLTFYYKDAVLMEDANSSNYVYSSKELERWQSLADNNLFWYIFDHEKQDYEHLFNFDIPRYNLTKIRKYAGQIEPNTGASAFDKDVLIHISQFVGYDVIPELTLMVRKNEAGPSRLIRYFFSTVTLVFTFGVIMPTLSSLFIPDKCINLVCVMVVIAVIIHILLCLPTILREELTLHPTYDYI